MLSATCEWNGKSSKKMKYEQSKGYTAYNSFPLQTSYDLTKSKLSEPKIRTQGFLQAV
jgi:hypothetical protein